MAIGTAIALAGASVASSAIQANSAKKAASAQSDAAMSAAELNLTAQREAIAAQQAAEDRIYEETAYSRGLGDNALGQMAGMGSFDPGEYTASDSYNFQLAEGQKSMDNMASARGMSRSGAAMKDALRFSQGLASDDYSDWYAREENTFNNEYNRLAGIANIGAGSQAQQIAATQSAASNTSNILTTGANTVGNYYTSAGDARASGYLGAGNALSGLMGDGAGLLGMYQGGYFDNQKPLNGLFS